MKKFVFRFESILNMRMDEEAEIGRALAILMNEMMNTERMLDEFRNRNKDFLKETDRKKAAGASVHEICLAEEGRQYFKTQILFLEEKQKKQYEKILEKRSELTEAMKKRKIMEKLKEKALEEFIEHYEQEERKVVEEIVTYKGFAKK